MALSLVIAIGGAFIVGGSVYEFLVPDNFPICFGSGILAGPIIGLMAFISIEKLAELLEPNDTSE